MHTRPMVEEDIPAALVLWQGLDGIGLRDADSPPALARYLRRNPATSGPDAVRAWTDRLSRTRTVRTRMSS